MTLRLIYIHQGRFRSQFSDMRTTGGVKDTLVVCVLARMLPSIFAGNPTLQGNAHAAFNKSLALVQQIQTSTTHKFSNLQGEPMEFYKDIYVPYLQHACTVYVRLTHWFREIALTTSMSRISMIPESKGFEQLLRERVSKVNLAGPDMDLAVEYVVPFTFEYSPM